MKNLNARWIALPVAAVVVFAVWRHHRLATAESRYED
jgi:hypothetical protein